MLTSCRISARPDETSLIGKAGGAAARMWIVVGLFLLNLLAPATAMSSSVTSMQDDEPVIAPLPERVLDARLFVTGISRAHQELRIYRQGVPEGETRSNESGDFAVAVNLTPGRNDLEVVAVDFERETLRSQTVSVEYAPWSNATPKDGSAAGQPDIRGSLPAPVLDTPATPALTNPIVVTGSATIGATVSVFVNSRWVRAGVVPGSGTFALNVPLEDGANTIYAVAEDTGGQSPASNSVGVSYTNSVTRTQSGTLAQDVAWTNGDGTPYTITGNLTVPAGVTLWLHAGATLKFAANTKLLVQGSLVIWGSSAAPVLLTSGATTPARNDWVSIEVASAATNVSIDYAQIEYAKYGLHFNGGSGTVTHSLIRSNDRGIYVQAPNASPTVTNDNEITANRYGVYVQGSNTPALNPAPVVTGNAIHGNAYSGSVIYNYYATSFASAGATILNATGNWWGTADPALIASRIYDWTDNSASAVVNYGGYLGTLGGTPAFNGPTLTGQITSDMTLPAVPHQVIGNIEVVQGVRLTLPAGTELSFPADYLLRVGGTLEVQGTSLQRVRFTSGRSSPARSDWEGIEIASTATAVSIDYADIEYAVNGLRFLGSSGSVTHSRIRNNDKGIWVQAPSAAPTITNDNEITANRYGLYVQGNGTAAQNPAPIVTGNQIYDNIQSGTTVRDYYAVTFGLPGSTRLNATGNWWGSSDPAAIGVHIYDWTDTPGSAVVDYSGYLGASGGAAVFPGPTLNGQITGTLALTATQYQVLGNVEVVSGASLSVPAGASILVTSSYVLRVNGSLQVAGASGQLALFTSAKSNPARNDWKGIEITATSNNVSVSYAQIEYAEYGLSFVGGSGTVTQSLIRANEKGVWVRAPNSAPSVSGGNEITENRSGVYVDGNYNAAQNPAPVVSGNSIHDNVYAVGTIRDYYVAGGMGNPSSTVLNATGNWWGTVNPSTIAAHIHDWSDMTSAAVVNFGGFLGSAGGSPVFPGPTLSGPVTASATLQATPYLVLGNVEVVQGATLTVPAGATLTFTDDYFLRVRGSLVVQGSSTQRVLFTSGETTPARSDWEGIEVTATATGVSIDYAQIEYAYNGLNFVGSSGSVSNTIIRDNERGIWIQAPNAAPFIGGGNQITANRFGIYMQGNAVAAQNPAPIVTGNAIHDNIYGVGTHRDYYVTPSFGDAANTTLDATGNWWGTIDPVAIASHINDHADASNAPVVDYMGYLDGSGGQTALGIYDVEISQLHVKPMQGLVGQGAFTLNGGSTATIEIRRDSDETVVYSDVQVHSTGGRFTFEWDGRSNAGDMQADGLYRAVLAADNGISRFLYDAAQPTTQLSVAGVVPPTYDPFRNEFWKLPVTMSPQGLLSLEMRVGGVLVAEPLSNVYYPAGESWVYWDGRDATGQLVTQQVSAYFPAPIPLRSTAFVVSGTKPVITGTGSVPNIEVKADPYLITHSYEEISTLTYRIDVDSYVTVKLLPPGIYDPGHASAITVVDDELQQAKDGGGAPIDHSVEWRGYEPLDSNRIVTDGDGAFTFTIEARGQQSNVATLYRGVLTVGR